MKYYLSSHLFICLNILLLFNCCTSDDNEKRIHIVNSTHQDSIRKDRIEIDSESIRPKSRQINREMNDVAKYIAGHAIESESKIPSSLINNEDWKHYATTLNQNWTQFNNTKIAKMKPWVEDKLSSIYVKTVFYPFAGADFLNAHILFPKALQYILVGLEPVGTFPNLTKIDEAHNLSFYLNTINTSLTSILNFSFFRTKSMAVDFHSNDVNGTIHVILFFIERTGNSIIDIKPIAINSTGQLINYSSFEVAQHDSLKNRGVKIDFVAADSIERSVFYFSINLENHSFSKNNEFKLFLKKQEAYVTFLKSASYLMHKTNFSGIRSTILSTSRAILQDDSGIPWLLFNDSAQTVTLYGDYTGVIPLFSKSYQADLINAYHNDSFKVQSLPFGIGYKYKEGQSNLMWRVRKEIASVK